MNEFIFIYITNPDKEKAKEIAKHLLNKRLIACANIFPIESIYRWEGKINDEEEFVAICKTTEDKFDNVKQEVESIHPYDTPCIIRIPVSSNEKYFNWLKGELE
jgi:periplasmic divalent cation tolerance protein